MDHIIEWNCRLDRNISRGFQTITAQDIGINNNLVFPQLPQQYFNPLVFDVCGGPAPLVGACAILSYMSFQSIREINPDFTVSQVQAAVRLPDVTMQYFFQHNEPGGWNEELFGPFKPCTIIRMRCPPSHRSETVAANWKYAIVAFATSPDQRLSIRGPLAQVCILLSYPYIEQFSLSGNILGMLWLSL